MMPDQEADLAQAMQARSLLREFKEAVHALNGVFGAGRDGSFRSCVVAITLPVHQFVRLVAAGSDEIGGWQFDDRGRLRSLGIGGVQVRCESDGRW